MRARDPEALERVIANLGEAAQRLAEAGEPDTPQPDSVPQSAALRGLATGAVTGGVRVNGVAVKPSRGSGRGDRLEISIGSVRRTVIVRGSAERRVSAALAADLYEQTEQSIAEG